MRAWACLVALTLAAACHGGRPPRPEVSAPYVRPDVESLLVGVEVSPGEMIEADAGRSIARDMRELPEVRARDLPRRLRVL